MKHSRRSVGNRYKLLKAVKNEVTARLEQSLHNSVRIMLLKETSPQPMQRLWDVDVKIGKRSAFQLKREVSIAQVFAQTGGKLMILGTPGSGKTTTILELASELISRAENDVEKPLPVLFNLSAWQPKHENIADWLVAELKSKYKIGNKVSKKWIKEKQLLPLLDGLDELEASQRELCLKAVNQLLEGEKALKHLVISSRLEEYKNSQTKLKLHGAIYLRPLNPDRIREYLMASRSRELWENIKTEPQLLDLARTPLLLNMMALAYEEILIHAWKRITSKRERYEYLLNAYVRRMLTQNIDSKLYPRGKEPRPETMRQWLIWLAKKMYQLNQQEVAIEKLDRNWLETNSQKRLYRLGVFLTLGGIMGVKKLILRFVMWRNGYIAWNYRRFLNLATERLFLQKVDGRYRFVHELLQKHFAQMEK
ncbi:MAG TPA: NACHT domain-containing protein [Leptolyngbyaceae cyanobacterium]